MATKQLNRVIDTLRKAALPQEGTGLRDGQLLESYIHSREEAAFAALVHRHGPMVWGVCRRVLDNHQDAEDAFQATFLVLVRKAATVTPKESVANWLYGVAHQTAIKARATTARRRGREKQVTAMPEPALEQQQLWNDMHALLDQELSCLPDKYRAVIVLCDLQGKTRGEAARQLKVPEGTVASRLATARTKLAKRLARHGLPVSGAALAAALAQNVALASLPLSVASNTIKAASLFAAGPAAATGILSVQAVALAEGVLKAMLLTKLKFMATVLLVASVLGAGVVAHTQQLQADKPSDRIVKQESKPAGQPAKKRPFTIDKINPKMLRQLGKRFDVAVVGRTDGHVSGTDLYFYDSAIETAAVHAGVVNKGEKAIITVTVVKCPKSGIGSTQHGVKSLPWDGARPDDTALLLQRRPNKIADKAPVEKPVANNLEQPEPVKEKEEAKELPTHVSGIAKAVDAQTNTITVSYRGGEATFRVAKDADINIDGKRGELAKLPAGVSVNLRQFVDAKTTRSVLAEGRWFSGVVKTVDAVNNTITFGDKAQDGAAGKTFNVPKDLPISIDNKAGKLAGIPSGASANLQLFADQTTVRSLSVEGRQVNGVVKAVDVKNRTITIDDATYPVAADAQIGIDHKPGKLEDLPAGANVGLNLRVDQKTVLRVSATGSSDFDQVKAVDAVNNTITVTGGPRNDRVYNVPADAPIAIDGKPGKLADIPPGAGLHALNLRVDQKTVSSINVVGPGYHHVGVKAVDGEKNTVTIDDKAPPEIAGKTFAVAPNANIEIDDKPGNLADIPAGAFVNLGLSVDSQTALNLQAEGPNLGDCGGSPISAVDAANYTITFADKGAAAVAGKTFNVLKDAWIQIDAIPGKLAELPAGSYVNVTLTVDQQFVRSIWAAGPPVPGTGIVKAVDAAKNTITVDDQTYPVAKNANIIIENRGGLAAVPIGATVSLRLCVDQKTVGTIAVTAK